ncbi:hypothetical protein [Aquimarina sp. 433]
MNNEITFLHNHWMIPIVVCCLIIWGIFIWKEWGHFSKPKFWIRSVVASLAILTMGILALQPALPIHRKNAKVVILTDDYKKSTLDSLKNQYRNLTTITYQENQTILKEIYTSDTIFVIGNGLASYDFWQLKDQNVTYINGAAPSGIIKYTYNQKATVGEQLVFKGVYNDAKKGTQLFLEEPSGDVIDSVTLQTDKNWKFELSATLKIAGNYTYKITEKDSLGTLLAKDSIPIQVAKRKNLRILIINDFPTFETKYLKNYLSEKGHKVLVKTKITKGKYKFEYFNTDRIPIGGFTEKSLAPYDLVILDALTAKNLSRNSRVALETVIRTKGLGLFIQPDESLFRTNNSLLSFDVSREKTSEVRLYNETSAKVRKYPFTIQQGLMLQPIHIAANESVVSGCKHIGKGKVGTTLLKETYELLLNGKSATYQRIWSDIINKIGKKDSKAIYWDGGEVPIRKDEPYEFTLRTFIPNPDVITENGYQISMARNIDIPNLWKGKIYPKTTGWNHIITAQDTTTVLNYYVTDTTTWQSNSKYNRIQANQRNFETSLSKDTKTTSPVAPVNPIGLYVFLICCLGYLWLAPKLS